MIPKMIRPFILATIAFMSILIPWQFSQANFTLRFDLETRIQEKVKSLIAPFDAYSQVVVTVHLKQLSVELPGAGAQNVKMDSSTRANSLSLEDVDSINILVTTQLDPVPENLKQVLDSAVDIPLEKKHFEFKKIAPEMAKLIPAENQSANRAEAFGDRLMQRLNWLFMVLGTTLIFVLVSLLMRRSTASSQNKVLETIATSVKDLAQNAGNDLGSAGSRSGTIQAPAETQSPVMSSSPAGEKDWLQSLGVDGLTALLSDCYWCEEDQYAAWILKQIRPDLVQEIFAKWPGALQYFTTLNGKKEKILDDHRHPYYLKPINITEVSTQDLQAWLKSYPGLWNHLPPMRQAKFDLSLLDRIELNQKSTSAGISSRPAIPAASIKKRALVAPFSVGQISIEDEKAIYENPTLIPALVRSQIPSLVWLALIDEKNRREILGKIHAQSLAEIWVGPEAVLAKLAECLPEKKRVLVLDYSRKIPKNRNSDWMNFVMRESIPLLDSTEDSDSAQKNAA